MATITAPQREVIKRCKKSVTWFLARFGKVKHPSAGIIDFNPFKYQKYALGEFRKHRYNVFRKCFAEGSMVWTPIGPRPIETLVKGDLVYVYNEKLGATEIAPVTAAWCSGHKEVVEVRSKTGHRSLCTADHQFHTDNGWVEAGDLETSDVLTEVHEPERYGKGNKTDAILLGYLVTDGCYSGGGNGTQFHFTNTTWRYLLEYQKHFKLKFGKQLKIRPHSKKGEGKSTLDSYRLLSSDASAKQWLVDLGVWGHKAATKKLPECVFGWRNSDLAVLLNRMFAGDGWYSGTHCNEIGIGSESVLLLHQVKQLLSRFRIDSKFYPATATGIAKLRIFGTDNFQRFVDQIGIFNKTPRHEPLTRGFFFNRLKGQVKSVRHTKKTVPVYDLEVASHGNFIVDGAVVHNCRQAGVSKISGAYALWFAMFNSNKKILIVSRTDDDAMGFLSENIMFMFEQLPQWMQELWKPTHRDMHGVTFPNGSKIKSMSSHPDVLRSNASSLVIIDEAAFIPNMSAMWAAGWPTLQHGGAVIAISTCNGVGNWYWSTWSDSQSGDSVFNPISINWWDMDWSIEYIDSASGRHVRIAPTDGLVECDGSTIDDDKYGKIVLDPDKYGEKWSPWLEAQYRALQEKGESWKFEQEVLASFIGSGNTVLSKMAIAQVATTVREPERKISGIQTHINAATGERTHFDLTPRGLNDGLWVWRDPVRATPSKYQGGRILVPGTRAHAYVAGVDTSTGKSKDYHAIEIFDVDTMEQVAEYMGHCLPKEFAKIVDWVGRIYNCALTVVERNNGGDNFIEDLRDMMYPRLWRRMQINDKPKSGSGGAASLSYGTYGFFTGQASKATLNKCLLDYIREKDGEGYRIHSNRLKTQFETYVRKQDKSGRDTGKTEAEEGSNNYDDLVMATAMALYASPDAATMDAAGIMPIMGDNFVRDEGTPPEDLSPEYYTGMGAMAPMSVQEDLTPQMDAEAQLAQFAMQLGGIQTGSDGQMVSAGRQHKFDMSRLNKK